MNNGPYNLSILFRERSKSDSYSVFLAFSIKARILLLSFCL